MRRTSRQRAKTPPLAVAMAVAVAAAPAMLATGSTCYRRRRVQTDENKGSLPVVTRHHRRIHSHQRAQPSRQGSRPGTPTRLLLWGLQPQRAPQPR